MLVQQTPGQRNRQREECQPDQKLHPAKQRAAAAGRKAQKP